ncbi:hypothetical protein, partial [Yersinia artesiana]
MADNCVSAPLVIHAGNNIEYIKSEGQGDVNQLTSWQVFIRELKHIFRLDILDNKLDSIYNSKNHGADSFIKAASELKEITKPEFQRNYSVCFILDASTNKYQSVMLMYDQYNVLEYKNIYSSNEDDFFDGSIERSYCDIINNLESSKIEYSTKLSRCQYKDLEDCLVNTTQTINNIKSLLKTENDALTQHNKSHQMVQELIDCINKLDSLMQINDFIRSDKTNIDIKYEDKYT